MSISMTAAQQAHYAAYHSLVNPTPVAASTLAVSGAKNPVSPPTTGAAASVSVRNQLPTPHGQPHVTTQNQNALNANVAPAPWQGDQTVPPQGPPTCANIIPRTIVRWGGAAFTNRKAPPKPQRGTVVKTPTGAAGSKPALFVL